MATFFVSRHPGALEWMKNSGTQFDKHVTHLNLDEVGEGDVVIGSLPVNIVADVCHKKAKYIHLSIRVNAEDRGKELSANQLADYDATLEEYFAEKR